MFKGNSELGNTMHEWNLSKERSWPSLALRISIPGVLNEIIADGSGEPTRGLLFLRKRARKNRGHPSQLRPMTCK
ncbi:hypothetical protein C1J03_18505 [Sulfitobacter sp. SK012]|nr:hypothetical protein C1J03_18505 [Sulfitobacter sp. SK012]